MTVDSAAQSPIRTARSPESASSAPSVPLASREHLPTNYVDGVRGIAATYVMLGHARFLLFIGAGTVLTLGLGGLVKYEAAALLVTRYGVAAVMAFFLVSGYAIHYRQAFKLAKGDESMSWRDYAWHRFRRLYPPLLAAVVLTAICDTIGSRLYPALYLGTSSLGGGDQSLTWGSLLSTLTFTQGFLGREFGTDVPLWSLAYEAFFYVMYPFALAVNRRAGPAKTLLAFSVLGGGAALLNGLGLNLHALDLLALWPAWIGGMFIADARAGRVKIPEQWWNIFAIAGLVLMAGTALALLKLERNINVNVNFFFLPWILSFAGPIGWLCAAKHTEPARARVVKVSRPLLGLGAMSYSLYVVHYPVLALISAWYLSSHGGALPTKPWLFFGGVAVALAAGFAVYWVAERPVTGKRAVREERGIERTVGDAAVPLVAPAGVPAAALTANHDARPYVPVGNTFIGTEDLTMREVRHEAEQWTTRRWNLPSRIESTRELGQDEWGFVAHALGYQPERAWMVTMQVCSPAGDWSQAQRDTAVIAQRQGAIFPVEPPAARS
jgi:peptidoglycan/LPS O-acetylase OafA/YrhL